MQGHNVSGIRIAEIKAIVAASAWATNLWNEANRWAYYLNVNGEILAVKTSPIYDGWGQVLVITNDRITGSYNTHLRLHILPRIA